MPGLRRSISRIRERVCGRHLARPAGQAVTGGLPSPSRVAASAARIFSRRDNLDEAIEVASRMPATCLGGSVEGRPLGGAVASLGQVFRRKVAGPCVMAAPFSRPTSSTRRI
jgi:hypothetical protein